MDLMVSKNLCADGDELAECSIHASLRSRPPAPPWHRVEWHHGHRRRRGQISPARACDLTGLEVSLQRHRINTFCVVHRTRADIHPKKKPCRRNTVHGAGPSVKFLAPNAWRSYGRQSSAPRASNALQGGRGGRG